DAVDFHRLRRGDTERRQEEADAEGHDEPNNAEPHGGVLPNTRVFTVGVQRGAPPVDSGYYPADLGAIGMKTPPAPLSTCLHYLILVPNCITAPVFCLSRKTDDFCMPFQSRCIRNLAGSLDHLVRLEEECWRQRQAQCLGGLEVDDQFVFRGHLDR